jgi:hypothetical protein
LATNFFLAAGKFCGGFGPYFSGKVGRINAEDMLALRDFFGPVRAPFYSRKNEIYSLENVQPNCPLLSA